MLPGRLEKTLYVDLRQPSRLERGAELLPLKLLLSHECDDDGLEIFLSSDVTGRVGGVGSQDIWVATRATTLDLWSTPVNLGPTVNSTAFDGAPALSFDGTTLYFFSERVGGFGKRDLYVTTRTRLRGPDMAEDAGVDPRGKAATHGKGTQGRTQRHGTE